MPLFDPDTGKVVDREALRSVGFAGAGMSIPRAYVADDGRKHVPVEHEHGGVAGEQIYHPDGRVSANVFARAVEVNRGSAE